MESTNNSTTKQVINDDYVQQLGVGYKEIKCFNNKIDATIYANKLIEDNGNLDAVVSQLDNVDNSNVIYTTVTELHYGATKYMESFISSA